MRLVIWGEISPGDGNIPANVGRQIIAAARKNKHVMDEGASPLQVRMLLVCFFAFLCLFLLLSFDVHAQHACSRAPRKQ